LLVAGLVLVTFLRNVIRSVYQGTANAVTQPYIPQDLNPKTYKLGVSTTHGKYVVLGNVTPYSLVGESIINIHDLKKPHIVRGSDLHGDCLLQRLLWTERYFVDSILFVRNMRNNFCPIIFSKFGRSQLLGRRVISGLQFSSTAHEQSTDFSNGMRLRDSETKRTMNINIKGLHSGYQPVGWKVVPRQLSHYSQGTNSHCCAGALALPAVRFLLLLLRLIKCYFTAVLRWLAVVLSLHMFSINRVQKYSCCMRGGTTKCFKLRRFPCTGRGWELLL
jgi:hypothetical protein